jgi:hypothetical protein
LVTTGRIPVGHPPTTLVLFVNRTNAKEKKKRKEEKGRHPQDSIKESSYCAIATNFVVTWLREDSSTSEDSKTVTIFCLQSHKSTQLRLNILSRIFTRPRLPTSWGLGGQLP